MSDSPTYICVFDDRHDRRIHAKTNDPVELLASRVTCGDLSQSQLDKVHVYEITTERDVRAEVKDLAVLIRRAEEVRLNQEAFYRKVRKGKVSEQDIEALRARLRATYPEENYDPPWPASQPKTVVQEPDPGDET